MVGKFAENMYFDYRIPGHGYVTLYSLQSLLDFNVFKVSLCFLDAIVIYLMTSLKKKKRKENQNAGGLDTWMFGHPSETAHNT